MSAVVVNEDHFTKVTIKRVFQNQIRLTKHTIVPVKKQYRIAYKKDVYPRSVFNSSSIRFTKGKPKELFIKQSQAKLHSTSADCRKNSTQGSIAFRNSVDKKIYKVTTNHTVVDHNESQQQKNWDMGNFKLICSF